MRKIRKFETRDPAEGIRQVGDIALAGLGAATTIGLGAGLLGAIHA